MPRIMAMVMICTAALIWIVFQTPPAFVHKVRIYLGLPSVYTAQARTSDRQSFRAAGTVRPAAAQQTPVRARQVTPSVVSSVSPQTLNLRSVPDGAIVGVLKRGQLVERRFEVDKEGRKWSLVMVRDQNLSGYLENDNLESPRN